MADKRPYVAMVVVQVIVAGMAMISKAAFNMGMNTFIFLFYRQAFSVIFLLPLCLIFRSTFQSFLVAVAFERRLSKWKLHFDFGLLAIAYSGLFIGVLAFYLQTWSIDKKGLAFICNLYSIVSCDHYCIVCIAFRGNHLSGKCFGRCCNGNRTLQCALGKDKRKEACRSNTEYLE
ncbi:hypothetical protein J5N97_022463 [Dioscorea zingiberensis]|uniref:WAT1-related protein n=1 Tax=Dioscorea zingiberensis TaxID=325984 RepID=A0A9D5HAK2_9LILI|nr:hypothetical protein J5N97_022463 [Dioscorea zingiberensis]